MPNFTPQGTGFQIQNTAPVDKRIVVANITDAFAYSGNNVYQGLTVYDTTNQALYILTGSDHTNINGWKQIQTISTNLTELNSLNISATVVGLSASAPGETVSNPNTFPQMSSSFPFYKLGDGSTPAAPPVTGSLWVVAGETDTPRTGSNGLAFVYYSSSTVQGNWFRAGNSSVQQLQSIVDSSLSQWFENNSEYLTINNSTTADSASITNLQDNNTYYVTFAPNPGAGTSNQPFYVNTSALSYDNANGILNTTASQATSASYVDVVGDNIEVNYVNSQIQLTASSGITYYPTTSSVSNNDPGALKILRIIDFDSNVYRTWDAETGELVLYFGTPASLDATSVTPDSNWVVNRFNDVGSTYTVVSQWSYGGYNTYTTASLYMKNGIGGTWTLMDSTYANVGTLTTTFTDDSVSNGNDDSTTSGIQNQYYKLDITGSNALGQTAYDSVTTTKTLNKTLPDAAAILNVQFASSVNPTQDFSSGNKIEYGDAGDLTYSYTPNASTNQGWNRVTDTYTVNNTTGTTFAVNSANTSDLIIRVSSSFESPALANVPQRFYINTAATQTVSRVRSIRIVTAAVAHTYFTQNMLENMTSWLSTYTSGNHPYRLVQNQTATLAGKTFNIQWSGEDRRIFVFHDAAQSALSGISQNNFPQLGSSFNSTPVLINHYGGQYRMYYTTDLLTPPGGTNTYVFS